MIKEEKNCFKPCPQNKVDTGLCDCINNQKKMNNKTELTAEEKEVKNKYFQKALEKVSPEISKQVDESFEAIDHIYNLGKKDAMEQYASQKEGVSREELVSILETVNFTILRLKHKDISHEELKATKSQIENILKSQPKQLIDKDKVIELIEDMIHNVDVIKRDVPSADKKMLSAKQFGYKQVLDLLKNQ